MYQRSRARALLAGFVFAALVLITVDMRAGRTGPLDRVRGLTTTAFGPIQEGVSTVTAPIGSIFSSVRELFDLRGENQRLRERIEELEAGQVRYDELVRQHDELRTLLAMAREEQLEGIGARTIANSPSNFEWLITIDVGSMDGVELDMPVVNAQGLVGKVIQVGATSSRVLLVIDFTFFAASRDLENDEIGFTRGQGGGLMRFQPIDPEGAFAAGDRIATSSYEYGVFPAGIPIGEIEDPGETTSGMNRTILVRPYVDFTALDAVFVVFHGQQEVLPPPEPLDRLVTPPPVEGAP